MRKREILGTPVSITDYDGALAAIEAAVSERRRIYICCAPASSLIYARDDAALAAALREAAIVTPDGMGVVHAARLLGEKLSDRVYGPDLMELHCARAVDSGMPIFLYGGYDARALAQLQSKLLDRFPGLTIAGAHSPPHREMTAQESAKLAFEINDSGAQVVWVGIGSPKQELWMQAMRDELDAPVLIGVGAAFDFLSGRVAQAPRWMQRSSLEWLYRLTRDPMRLGRRYLATLPRFAVLVAAQALRERKVR
jgi:N-acetylglucosaminyldiphosphoundecaprenol N-acetyl-beta-D-mannosaminyltransferase